jgi:hypothetical protein
MRPRWIRASTDCDLRARNHRPSVDSHRRDACRAPGASSLVPRTARPVKRRPRSSSQPGRHQRSDSRHEPGDHLPCSRETRDACPSGDHEGLLPPSRRLIGAPSGASEWTAIAPEVSNATSIWSGLTSTAPIVLTAFASSRVGKRPVLGDGRTALPRVGASCARVVVGALAQLTTQTMRTRSGLMRRLQTTVESNEAARRSVGLSACRLGRVGSGGRCRGVGTGVFWARGTNALGTSQLRPWPLASQRCQAAG